MAYKQIEKEAVSEVDNNIQDFIDYALIVATGTLALSKKKKLINKKFETVAVKNEKAIKAAAYSLYKAGKDKTYSDIKKKAKTISLDSVLIRC